MSAGSEVIPALIPNVSRETRTRLERYHALYERWSKSINLTATSTQGDFWQRHVADSTQLLDLAPDALHWTDLGSGGGFPGMVLAIALSEKPGARVDLVESNRKKTAFLQAVKAEAAPAAVIHPVRVEDFVGSHSAPEVVTARALASLTKLLTFVAPWLSAGSRALFHKGRGYAAEIEESHANWAYDLVIHKSRVDADSVVLDIANLRPR